MKKIFSPSLLYSNEWIVYDSETQRKITSTPIESDAREILSQFERGFVDEYGQVILSEYGKRVRDELEIHWVLSEKRV